MLLKGVLRLGFVLLAFCASAVFAAEEGGQTVLITGANRGIGLEMARQFSERGDTVIGTARNPEEAADLKALRVRVEPLDVTDSASVASLAQRLAGVPIDLLVNNAGVRGQTRTNFAEFDFDAAARTLDVNSLGPMRVTQALLPNLQAGEGKTVIQVSSIAGSLGQGRGGSFDYRASKAALNMFNRALASALSQQGFVCVAIHPGWVKTRMGGEHAPVETKDSVAGMLEVIDGLMPQDNGRFLDYRGNGIPW